MILELRFTCTFCNQSCAEHRASCEEVEDLGLCLRAVGGCKKTSSINQAVAVFNVFTGFVLRFHYGNQSASSGKTKHLLKDSHYRT